MRVFGVSCDISCDIETPLQSCIIKNYIVVTAGGVGQYSKFGTRIGSKLSVNKMKTLNRLANELNIEIPSNKQVTQICHW